MSKCEKNYTHDDSYEVRCEVRLDDWCDPCSEKKHNHDAWCDAWCESWCDNWFKE